MPSNDLSNGTPTCRYCLTLRGRIMDLIWTIIAAIFASAANAYFPVAGLWILKMSWQIYEMALQFIG
jgi:hypothetical protein